MKSITLSLFLLAQLFFLHKTFAEDKVNLIQFQTPSNYQQPPESSVGAKYDDRIYAVSEKDLSIQFWWGPFSSDSNKTRLGVQLIDHKNNTAKMLFAKNNTKDLFSFIDDVVVSHDSKKLYVLTGNTKRSGSDYFFTHNELRVYDLNTFSLLSKTDLPSKIRFARIYDSSSYNNKIAFYAFRKNSGGGGIGKKDAFIATFNMSNMTVENELSLKYEEYPHYVKSNDQGVLAFTENGKKDIVLYHPVNGATLKKSAKDLTGEDISISRVDFAPNNTLLINYNHYSYQANVMIISSDLENIIHKFDGRLDSYYSINAELNLIRMLNSRPKDAVKALSLSAPYNEVSYKFVVGNAYDLMTDSMMTIKNYGDYFRFQFLQSGEVLNLETGLESKYETDTFMSKDKRTAWFYFKDGSATKITWQ